MPISAHPNSAPASRFRMQWQHSLRFRLALLYSLGSLAIVSLIGLGMMLYFYGQLSHQFEQRLNERANFVVDGYTKLEKNLGKTDPTMSGYTALLDEDGYLIAASRTLETTLKLKRDHDGSYSNRPFAYRNSDYFEIANVPMYAVSKAAGDFGTVWVAMSAAELDSARQSASRALMVALVLTPLLMLLLGWWMGRRALTGLGQAAEMADCLNPKGHLEGLESIPLPAKKDEVYRLVAAINHLLGRIAEGQAREKQLLGQIVHELGAPLTVLKATLSRAGERSGDPEVLRAALVADELTFTTQDLMQLARGQLEMKLVWHYLGADVLRGRLDRLVPKTTFKGDWQAGILCDPDRLTQALRNLLANARRAAGAEGWVSINLSESKSEVVFCVQDSGEGLPPDLGERIFDPFVSGAGSSGLGLSVSRQIAKMHGGNLTGGNHAGGGAEFILSLPAVSLDEDDEE